MNTVIKQDLVQWLHDSLRSGYLFGCFDEPLDEAGKRVVRVILNKLAEAEERTKVEAQEGADNA